MKPSLDKVINLLRRNRRVGVTFDDVPRGTCITKRISEARAMGYHITSTFEKLSNGGHRARWHLIKEI